MNPEQATRIGLMFVALHGVGMPQASFSPDGPAAPINATATPEMSTELEQQIEWQQSVNLLYRIDALYNRMPPLGVAVNQENFDKWVAEVTPWFEEVHIVDKTNIPTSLTFKEYPGAFEAHHVIGQSDCGASIIMNARQEDTSLSSWRDSLNFWGGVVHEDAHAQQGAICADQMFAQEDIETSAQVGMMTVLAAMTTGGSKIAAYSFINEMRDLAMGSLYFQAIRDKKVPEYWAIMNAVETTPLEQARLQRMMNSYAGKEGQFIRQLFMYEYRPLRILLEGEKTGEVDNLQFPNHRFPIADFAYLMKGNHLEQVVGQLEGEK